MRREVSIRNIYQAGDSDCHFDGYDSKEHSLYTATNFTDYEYNVYEENGLLPSIQ